MATWAEFVRARPDLASAARDLLYQFGVGLAFMATTRRDGGPRVHPMCPLLTDDAMYAFIVPGPKQGDLRRDGRYAIHSFPCADNEDGCYLTGSASVVDDAALRAALGAQFVAERSQFAVPFPPESDALFVFAVDSVMITRTTGHGDPSPAHMVWRVG